eukprot:CAMPEP_0117496878 /NCGR_PEP_ID=MMETSP0784-20121206/20887_1 /TAXON_ID=39447 /ORGANISM="" /LENGTH=582 /DNA_ID=CAMNT_0005291869 /DNA_START=1 /DNA_END=1749 /DNA_ORIENTATION=+
MQAYCILAVFIATLALRKKLYRRKTQEKIHAFRVRGVSPAALLQPHTGFLIVLLSIYLYLVCVFVEILQRYPWLEPSTFTLPTINGTEVGYFQQYKVPSWLRGMCVICPAFIGVTLAITIVHIWFHFPKNRGFDEHLRWYPSYSHDLAIQVVALPLVYGIFALDSVYQMLRLVTGEAYSENTSTDVDARSTWDRFENYLNSAYLVNFELADLYEAWALRSFSVLCFVRVSRQIRLEVPTVQFIIQTVKRHLAGVQDERSRDRRILDDLTILNNPKELLFEPLRQTAGIGVMVFVYTYALKSIYLLGLSLLASPPFDVQLCGPQGLFQAACSLTNYVDGAAFLASTLAIYNLVVFEHRLKDILRREMFKPEWKFITVKIMVSIAFMQDWVLNVVMGSMCSYSDVQISICYACLICFEVLPISLMVFFAWMPVPNDWYSGDCWYAARDDAGSTSLGSGRLADEKPGDDDDYSSSFVASRQPSAMVETDVTLGIQVAATIELHGKVSAQEGNALADMVNAMSKTMTAVYKPAALFRTRPGVAVGAHAGLVASASLPSLASVARRPSVGSSSLVLHRELETPLTPG